ncbi:kinase-like protein [Artomyces pyxidatus]|uniref:Kinase-like protein n=1 Tax=Artomyces pyxidatus TaxID=48021 RepID=A0ACB8SFK5_9AGAM|nr:kinase-like protein [Artomyces pyxidatus]
MSEPELAYMNGANEDFDLPRWQTQPAHPDILSSSAQAAHTAASNSYLYPASVPPPPTSSTPSHSRPPLHQSPSSSNSRQPRINQLLEEDPSTALPYLSPGQTQLSRSASLGAGPATASRARRHHLQDDLEGAFGSTNTQPPAHQRQQSNSFYPSSVAYQTSSFGANSADPNSSSSNPPQSGAGEPAYQDMYFNSPSSHPPKRSHTQHDASTSARAARSPLRTGNISSAQALLDPYAQQQQSQYSPTTAAYNYQSSYHGRSQSQVKNEVMTPPLSSPYPPPPSVYAMDTSSPHPPPPPSALLSSTTQSSRQNSISQPNTPIGFPQPAHSPVGAGPYYPQDQPMAVDPPAKRRASGFRRVRDHRDLRPHVNTRPAARRMDASGSFLSPLRQLTTNIVDTYHICNPSFKYESTHNPRRVLTKPSKPAHNEGYDNEDYDYILYVNDWLGTEEGHKYLILDVLGQGTFGQVVKCQDMKTHDVVAVKVVKNKPAYFNQSMMEVTILELLNNQCDPNDEHHILRLRDSFIHRNHLCLVFELLSSNLYELIKQNQFQGLSTQLVKVFTAQLLDAMSVLKDARLIHCDLKPENILLKSLQSPQIKVIDFGSACHERQTVYTYIQSRFYRSPEVLLGLPYTAAIDMWSLGCIAVELFLGLPLFPGTSEYNQITRIVEMLGQPPQYMMEMGKQTGQFFDSYVDMYGRKKYRLKSIEQYSREHNTNEQPGKQYFKANSLPEIVNTAPMPNFKSGRQGPEMEKELNNRASFIDFCQGLLNMNPIERWSPQQARLHPFITGEKFTKPFVPSGHPSQQQVSAAASSATPSGNAADPKRPYGGLVPSQPKGTRAYQDAASYNQTLAQHQAYTAQAQAASQAANNVFRNPYIQPPSQQQSSSSGYTSQPENAYAQQQQQQHAAQYATPAQSQITSHRGLVHRSSHGSMAGSNNSSSGGQQHYSTSAGGNVASGPINPNVPSNSYYPNSRVRANTINQMDNVPPALARLQHMSQDVIGGRNALTPVLNRDDAMKEWERRQSGKAAAAQPYPQLEFLQQQAELAAASGMTNWGTANRYPPPSSGLAHQYHPPAATVVVDDERRDAILSNVRAGARGGDTSGNVYAASNVISSPPQVYTAGATTTGNRYANAYPQQTPGSSQPPSQPSSNTAFDTVERRPDMGPMYVPMQPEQFQSYSTPGAGRGGGQPAQALPASFYGPAVVGAQQGGQQQRALFAADGSGAAAGGQGSGAGAGGQSGKDRRTSGMEFWPR